MAARKSRLQRAEEAKAAKTFAFYLVLTIAVLVVMFFVGLPAITKVTELVLGITGSENVDFGQNTPPPPPPEVNTPPAYTNQDTIRFTGRTRPGYTVSVFFNNDKIEVLANAEGEFTTNLELSASQNTVSALVTDSNGQESVKTQTYTVHLDKEPPELNIAAPQDGSNYYGARNRQITIEGQTDSNARVAINERVVIVRPDGHFEYTTSLNEGENKFEIKSIDAAGNETETKLTLHFTP